MKFPRCNNGTAMQSHRRYQGEGDDFLGRIVAMDVTWARSANQMNGRIPVLVVQRKCVLHNMLFTVAYDTDGVILHQAVPPSQMVNAAYYCTFLHAPPSSSVQEKTTTLGGTEPHHSSWQYSTRSHTPTVTDLLRRWKWDILEHPPYSPDMSPYD